MRVGLGEEAGLGRGSTERKSCPFFQLQNNGNILNTKILKFPDCERCISQTEQNKNTDPSTNPLSLNKPGQTVQPRPACG